MLYNIKVAIAVYSVTALYVLDVKACKWGQQPGLLCLQSMHSASHSDGPPSSSQTRAW